MMRAWFEAYMAMPKPNATEAARIAGYKYPNKSGPNLLENPKIIAAIEDALRPKVMAREAVLARLSSQANADYSEFITTDGRIDLTAMKEAGKMHLIKHIRIIPPKFPDCDEEIEVTFHDAQTALVQLGRYYKLFTDKIEETNPVTDALARALDDINGRFPITL